MFNANQLAANIRKGRLYRNYSQDYLAYKLGMSQNGYSKIELGYTTLTVEKLVIIVYFGETDHPIPWQTDHLNCWRKDAANAVEAFTKIVI